MFKTRIWYKLMLGFALVIAFGGLLVAFTIDRATRTAFDKMIREGDLVIARDVALSLGSWYESEKSWSGAWEIIGQIYPYLYPGNSDFTGHREGPMPRMGNKGMAEGFGGRRSSAIHIVVTDTAGKILFSSNTLQGGSKLTFRGEGAEILANDRIVGYVYAGSMIGSGFLPFQEEFLKTSAQAIFLSLFSMIVLASIVGFFLIRHITEPVNKLTLASREISRGNLNVRVDVKRNDELGELSDSFNAMAASLLKAEEWKRRIIADAAHELRTPLSLIQGRLEMMLEGIYKIDREGVETVYDETLLLTKLIEELSELSDTEAGTITLSREFHSVKEILEYSAGVFLPALEGKNLSMPVRIMGKIPLVFVDFQKMNQVIGNLISNSIRYTPEGGTITLSSWYDSSINKVFIAVEDTGTGIPESEREKIFERFYRSDSHRSRKHGGSGLGLAITREIIHLHGGEIAAEEPPPGVGSRIVISLPLSNMNP